MNVFRAAVLIFLMLNAGGVGQTPVEAPIPASAPEIVEPAAQDQAGPAVPIVEDEAPPLPRIWDFSADETGLVLRTLARCAGIDLVLSEMVSQQGTVTMRRDNKTPMEMIEIVVASKGLVLDEFAGVFFVKTAAEFAQQFSPKLAERAATELADFQVSYFKKLRSGGLPEATAAALVEHEDYSKGRFSLGYSLERARDAHSRISAAGQVPTDAYNSVGFWEMFQKGIGGGTLCIGSAIPVILMNLCFAVAVFVDGRRIQQRGGHLQFFGPLLWALAALVGGFVVPAGFWLMHHSSLRTASGRMNHSDTSPNPCP